MHTMNKTFIFFVISVCSFNFLLNAQTNSCDVVVDSDGSIKTHPNAKIGVYGNLENNGSISDNGGDSEVGFYSNTQSLEVNGDNTPEFANLIVDVADDLQVNVKTDVTAGVLFLNGRVITQRNIPEASLDLVNTDITVNVDDLKHVDGYTSYTGDAAYTFPVGDDLRNRPISIDANTSLDTAKAAYFFENPGNSPSFPFTLDLNDTDSEVFNVSSFEFWDLDGSTSTRATLTWDIMSNLSQILNSDNLSELIVTGWSKDEQRWVNLGNFAVEGNLSEGSITSTLFNPDDFEALTFATDSSGIDPDIAEPVDLIVFNGISGGDQNGINDFFGIQNISEFPNNTLQIYNRWGVKVFDVDGYDAEPVSSPKYKGQPTNAFRGKSNGRITVNEDDLLPVGTYYYILTYIVDSQGGEKTLAGYLYINR